MVSDSEHYVQCLAASQLNSILAQGEMQNGIFFRLEQYVVNKIQDKPLIIMLQVTLLGGPMSRIGTPTPYPGTELKNPPPQQQQQQYQPPPQQQQPQYQKKRQQPAANGGGFTKISALNPYMQRFCIKARITNKGPMKTWSKPTSEGKLFGLELADASGEIRAVCFKDLADRLYNTIEEGMTYVITETSGRLKPSNKQWTTVAHEYEITFGSAVTFDPCPDDEGDIPAIVGDFSKKLSDLATNPPAADSSVDLVAVVKAASPVSFIVSKKSGKENAKREVTLVDDSNYDIKMTFWGDLAQKPDEFWATNPVLAARGCRVSSFGGLSLSSSWSGSYKFDLPRDAETMRLRRWFFDEGGKDQPSTPLTGGISGGNNVCVAVSARGCLNDIARLNLGANPDKADYITFKGTLNYIKSENMWYPACPTCNKKVAQHSDESWYCEKCQATHEDCTYRYMLTTGFIDESGNSYISAFNDQGIVLFNDVSADQICNYKGEVENHDGVFDDYIKSHTNYQFLVKARVKMDTWQETSRIKVSIVAITPIDFVSESSNLIDAIKNL